MRTVFRIPRCRAVLALLPVMLSSVLSVAAPAPVEEIGIGAKASERPARQTEQTSGTLSPAATAVTAEEGTDDPYYRYQMLLEEIRQLRGLVEEQGNELARLKKQQHEDYLDLDGRLAALAGGAAGSAATGSTSSSPEADSGAYPSNSGAYPSNSASPADASPAATTPGPVSGDESAAQADYDRAYGLLKERKTRDAKVALRQFVSDHPSSTYSANAHYWLGELHLLDGELPQAEAQFLTVVEKFPANRKVSDATFKLGKVSHMLGKHDQARIMLERAAAGTDSAARLAQDYLLQNY